MLLQNQKSQTQEQRSSHMFMSGRKIQVNKGEDLSSTINSVRLLKETNMPLNNGSLNKNFIPTMNNVIKRLVTYSTFIEAYSIWLRGKPNKN